MNHELDRYAEVAGVRTRYWELGAGPPVVLIHGLGASVETWTHTIDALAADHHVYALDLVGFGSTEKPDVAYTPARFVDFVLAFMTEMGLTRAALIGHSMGGTIAARIAGDHSDRVAQLVIADSAGLSRDVHLGYGLMALPLIGRWLLRGDRDQIRQNLQALFYDPARVTDALVDLNYDLITQPGARAAYLSTVRNIANLRGLRPAVVDTTLASLRRITAPTLVVWGRQDRVAPVDHAYLAQEMIPGARLQLFDECGHLPHVEQAVAFNAAVIAFLRST